MTLHTTQFKLKGTLKTTLVSETSTGTIDINFTDQDANVVDGSAVTLLVIDPEETLGQGSEIISAASSAFSTPLTTLTTATRGGLFTGSAFSGSSTRAKKWGAGTPIGAVTHHIDNNFIKSVLEDGVNTGGTNLELGDGTNDATQGFEINQGISASTTKYGADGSGNPLITLPGGSSFIPGAGAGSITGGDGIDFTTSVVSVDLGTDPGLEFVSDKLEAKIKASGGLVKDSDGLSADFGEGANKVVEGDSAFLVPTGAILDYFGASAPTDWVLLDGDTLGSGASGADHAGTDYQALYEFLWDNLTDTNAPVSTGRGGSAAADFAADKTLTMPDASGKTAVMLGGTAFTALGKDDIGAEDHTLSEAEMPAHTHDVTPFQSDGNGSVGRGITTPNTAVATSSTGGDTAHNNNQPSIVTNKIIKL